MRRVGVLAALSVALVSVACGEKFQSGVESSAGSSSSGKATAGDVAMGGSGGAAAGGSSGGKPGGGGGVGGALPLAGRPPLGGDASIGGGPVVVPPIPQEGLELWLRVDAGVVAGDGVVTSWQDSSGKSRNATQTAANYRPRLMANAIGQHPGVVFDGQDDFMKLPALEADFSKGVSVFFVFQQDAEHSCGGYFEASNGPELDDLHLGDWNRGLNYEVNENWVNPYDTVLLGEPQLAVGVHKANQLLSLRSNSNGLEEDTINLPQVVTREEVLLGSSLYAECTPFPGRMGELILYSRPVSDQELLDIEGYLQGKWNCCKP